ncbi:hypothetical protein HanPSC8_Chr13g0593171 [Helianthus annuus]|nr:hypothetical protein HanPSC8_Chr13g0593171 [Helianthus annuus]
MTPLLILFLLLSPTTLLYTLHSHFTSSVLTMADAVANELLKVLVKKMTDEAFKRVARAQGIYNELKEF